MLGGVFVRLYVGCTVDGMFIPPGKLSWTQRVVGLPSCVSVVRVSVARVPLCVLHFNRDAPLWLMYGVDMVNVVFLVEVLCFLLKCCVPCHVVYLKLLYVLFDCCVSF